MSATGIYKRCMWWDSLTNWPNGNTAGAEEKCIERALARRNNGVGDADGDGDVDDVLVFSKLTPIEHGLLAARGNGTGTPITKATAIEYGLVAARGNGGSGDTYTKNIDVSAGGSVPIDTRRSSQDKESEKSDGSANKYVMVLVVLAIAYFILFR